MAIGRAVFFMASNPVNVETPAAEAPVHRITARRVAGSPRPAHSATAVPNARPRGRLAASLRTPRFRRVFTVGRGNAIAAAMRPGRVSCR